MALLVKFTVNLSPAVTTPSLAVPLLSETAPTVSGPVYIKSPELMEKFPDELILSSSSVSALAVICTSSFAPVSQSVFPSESLAVAEPSIAEASLSSV